MTQRSGHIVIIDPARHTPEIDCFNHLVRLSSRPMSYHLPALYGLGSLRTENMDEAIAIIILGSASSVNERCDWQKQLESWLLPHLWNRIPTLGICYGHQMLAYMFGGKVNYVFPDQRKHSGSRIVDLKTTACWQAESGHLIVSHNEMVCDVPSCMSIIASSSDIAIDGLAHKELPIWTLQSHPEATTTFLEGRQLYRVPFVQQLSFGHSLMAQFLSYATKHPPAKPY